MSTTPPATGAAAYVPGVCNINRGEIARRRRAGYFGAALFVVVLALLLATGWSRWFRVVLFTPAFLAAIGFLQAKNKFCVGYAVAGKQNAAPGSTTASDITDQSAHSKDASRARRMNMQALAIALLVTALCLLIPKL